MSIGYSGSMNNQGWQMIPDTTEPVKTPAGLLATRAIETKAGWIGQVIVDREILWESEPFTDEKDAQRDATAAASQRVIQALRTLLGGDS
jgi:hypothetical protein